MKAIISKSNNIQARLKINRDHYSLTIPSNFTSEDKERLKVWRKERVDRAKSQFEKYNDLAVIKEHTNTSRLNKFYSIK